MATIRTAIQLQDGVTPVIRSMHNAMQLCIGSFESMQRASSNSVNTASLSAARAELNKASIAMDAVEQNINAASTAQQKLNGQMRQGKDTVEGFAGKVRNMAAGIATAVGLTKIIGLSDSVAQTTARLDLMNDGLQTTAQLQQVIFESAQRSRSVYSDTANSVAKLGILAKSAFSSNAEIVAFAEQMNKQFTIGGASIQEQTAGMYQLTQAMASGRLQGDEFRSIIENAPMLAQAIAQYTGKSMAELREMSAEGQITANIIKNAMFAAADETNRKFASMPKTFGQIATGVKNQALMMFQPVLQQINMVANSKGFETLVNGLIGGLVILAAVAASVFNEVVYYGGLIADNWSLIAPAIWGTVAAYAAYNAEMLIAAVRTGAAVVAKIAHAAVSAAETMAIIALIAAQEGLNAALYACPLSWILMAVVALIAVFYLAIAAMNKWAGTSLSATGIIVGAIYVAGAVIGNIFIALYNTVIDIFAVMWNHIASFAEFFANVFNDPVGSIVRLFGNMADTVLSILSTIARAIDTLFGSKLSAAVEGWRSTLKGAVNAQFGEAAIKVQRVDPNALRLDRINYGNAWQSGYKMGEGIGNFNLGKLGLPGQGSGVDLSQFNNNVAEIADNTGKIKDSLEITEEDLKYLRDIAEQEVINRFTTAEIKIDMGGINNNVSSNMDLDGIVTHLTTTLEEAMQIAAEGVHK